MTDKQTKTSQKTTQLHEYATLKNLKDSGITGNALEIFKRRYSLKDKEGNPTESVEEAMLRIARHVAGGEESNYLKTKYKENFFQLLIEKRFVPNTPTWTGAETPLGQLAACFVLPIEDEMGKDEAGIFSTLRDAVLIQQTGGGNGFDFSKLRPKGDRVSTSNGIASGPVSFLEAYDSAFGQIAQGGTRRGANMGVLRVDHPDIRDFIKCKTNEGKIANFNISVAITDKFMQAVKDDTDFELINPRDESVWEKVNARELFNEIIKYAHHNGEPGTLFIDAANRENPVPNQYTLAATNPCGEQWLGPYENCCLGHVNISESIIDGKVDWNHLKDSTVLGTRFLDDVVTQNSYVPSVPKLKEAAHRNRRIGLGFLGLSDAMYKLGIRYGSEESFDFASQITEFIRYHSMRTSIKLAEEKGAFPGIKGSIYDPNDLKWKEPKSLVDYKLTLNRPNLDWSKITSGIKEHGLRNSTQMTVAPTGTTSTVVGVEGYGCEPVFALAYYRNVYQSAGTGEDKLQLTYVSPAFEKALNETELSEEEKKEVIKESIEKGTIQHLNNIPDHIKNTFVVSGDIKPEEHVMIQAAIQRFIDNSISKTINFPEGTTEEEVAKAYTMAWDLGCKGITVYVTGSRQEVVLETKETKDKKEGKTESNEEAIVEHKRPRPNVVSGRTHRLQTPFGKVYVTVNRNGETGEKPFEVFVTIGKSGSDVSATAEALGRLISGWLRSAQDPYNALEEIVTEMKGIGGATTVGFGPNRVRSLPDAISKVLQKELVFDSTKDNLGEKEEQIENSSTKLLEEKKTESSVFKNASVCSECGNMTLLEVEGCQKCVTCGYSKC